MSEAEHSVPSKYAGENEFPNPKPDRLLARIFHAFCVLFPAFVGGQAVSVRERASYAG